MNNPIERTVIKTTDTRHLVPILDLLEENKRDRLIEHTIGPGSEIQTWLRYHDDNPSGVLTVQVHGDDVKLVAIGSMAALIKAFVR